MISSLLTSEYTDFNGHYYQLTNARCEPKPVQARIPIVIGGRGPKRTLPAVARWADMWDLAGPDSPAQWKASQRRARPTVRGDRSQPGRDPPIGAPDVVRGGRARRPWPPTAADYAAAGVDLVIFSMRAPYRVARLEPLATALNAVN